MNLETLDTTGDHIALAREIAAGLDDTSRRFQTARAREVSRSYADMLALMCRALANKLGEYADAIRHAEHRKLIGIVVGYTDATGKRWYIHHGWCWGNVMRIPDIESAAVFGTERQVREWAEAMRVPKGSEGNKPWPAPAEQLARAEVRAWRVMLTAEEEVIRRVELNTGMDKIQEHEPEQATA